MEFLVKTVIGFITIVAAVLTASAIACKVMFSKPLIEWMIKKTCKIQKWATKKIIKEMAEDE